MKKVHEFSTRLITARELGGEKMCYSAAAEGQMDDNLECHIVAGRKGNAMGMMGGISFGLVLILGLATSVGSESKTGARIGHKQTKGKGEEIRPGKSEPTTYVLVGAGDVAGCSSLAGAAATAKLIEQIPGTVFVAGDLAYDRGTAEEFSKCYDTTWGKFKYRTRPAPGNHEYGSPGALPYFAYWGEQAGPSGKGYYSYDLGKWHVVALNTNCNASGVGGCGAGSEQEKWLKKDLEQHAKSCIVAYGHHALFSSGFLRMHAVHPELRDLWRDLYAAHADLMLAGHEHSYERFARQDPDGHLDPENGIREIVVGTGGRSHYPMGRPTANSEQRNVDTFGVLKLTLSPEKYSWEFVPVNGEGGFRDSGEQACHNAAAGGSK